VLTARLLLLAALLVVGASLLAGQPTEIEAQAPANTATTTSTRTATPTMTPTITPTFTITPTVTNTPGPWPMYQHDPQHTGRSRFSGPSRVRELWHYATGVSGMNGSPIVGPDGAIYVGGGGYLFAFNEFGAALWRAPLGDTFGTLLQTSDNVLYVTAASGTTNYLYQALPDGTVISRYQTTGSFLAPTALQVGPDGTVYFGVGASNGTSGVLYALTPDLVTGTMRVRWQLATGFLTGTQLALGKDGTLYFGTYTANGALYAIDSATGLERWHTEALGYINSSPSVDTDGSVYIGSSNGLYAITPNGLVRWVYRTSQPIAFSSPAIDVVGTLYVGAGDQLLAIDLLGRLLWHAPCLPGGQINSSAAIGADGTVYVQAILPNGTYSAGVCAVDSNGVGRWLYPTQFGGVGGPQVSSPAIGLEGTLYVASPDGTLYAFTSTTFNRANRVDVPLVLR
jgi:outer membrane protein assembly factor BamB